MAARMQEILDRIAALQDQLEAEIGKRREAFRYKIDNGGLFLRRKRGGVTGSCASGFWFSCARRGPWSFSRRR